MTRRATDTTRWSGRAPLALAVMTIWLLLVVLPFIWALLTSARLTREIVNTPFAWPENFWGALKENYHHAWVSANFSAYFINSLLVVLPSMVLILIVCAPAAYILGRYRAKTCTWLFIYILAGLMIPGQLQMVPLFFQYTRWSQTLTAWLQPVFALLGWPGVTVNLHNSHLGLVLIYVAGAVPFTVFILTGFFRTLPTELYEAGIIDGCTEAQAFWHVMLPLAKPGIVTICIFNFLGLWNEYFYALVFLTDEALKTLPLGLAAVSLQTNYEFDLGMQFAALTIVMLPTLLVYIVLQKQLTRGITLGALKG